MSNRQSNSNDPGGANHSYTYPQFVIDEKTGRIDVNFIDGASGKIIRHIPSAELGEIMRNHASMSSIRLA